MREQLAMPVWTKNRFEGRSDDPTTLGPSSKAAIHIFSPQPLFGSSRPEKNSLFIDNN